VLVRVGGLEAEDEAAGADRPAGAVAEDVDLAVGVLGPALDRDRLGERRRCPGRIGQTQARRLLGQSLELLDES